MWKKSLIILTLFAAQGAMAAESDKELHLIIKYKQAVFTAKSIQKKLKQYMLWRVMRLQSLFLWKNT